MRCVICDSTDKWENVDKYRMKPKAKGKAVGMAVCGGCGFVSYPEKWKSPEEIKEHYRKSYRPGPTSQNLFTGSRKIHYHNVFLHHIVEDWKARGVKPEIFEVGAAYGLVLAWLREKMEGKCNVRGSELTTSFRRVAHHELGIELNEDFDDSKKYDLIISYKVAEHQLDIDLELKTYAECLKDDGLLYISVPTWFDAMTCFGIQGFDLEYYYDPNHINVWTKAMFKYLLYKAGLCVLQEEHEIYDSTYICRRRRAEDAVPEFELEGPDNIKKVMGAIRAAYQDFVDGNYDRAIETFPNYPAAWVHRAEMQRALLFTQADGVPFNVKDPEQSAACLDQLSKKLFEPALAACPGKIEILVMCMDFSMRAKQFDAAVAFGEKALKISPENPAVLHHMINCMRELAMRAKSAAEKEHYVRNGHEMAQHLKATSVQHFREATDLVYQFAAEMPLPSEVADHQKSLRLVPEGAGS